jgi:hypothetical protein
MVYREYGEYGAWCIESMASMVYGAWCMVYRDYGEYGAWCMVYREYSEYGVWCMWHRGRLKTSRTNPCCFA